eukprot:4097776-Alexandrium_andersonii.AAC.1
MQPCVRGWTRDVSNTQHHTDIIGNQWQHHLSNFGRTQQQYTSSSSSQSSSRQQQLAAPATSTDQPSTHRTSLRRRACLVCVLLLCSASDSLLTQSGISVSTSGESSF